LFAQEVLSLSNVIISKIRKAGKFRGRKGRVVTTSIYTNIIKEN